MKDPLMLLLMYEAAYLALAAVLGMALQNVARGQRNPRSALLVMIAACLLYGAAGKLPHHPQLWVILAPAGLGFVMLGYLAGKGLEAGRRKSLEEQIAELTGDAQVNLADLTTDRGPRRSPWRR